MGHAVYPVNLGVTVTAVAGVGVGEATWTSTAPMSQPEP